MTEPVQGELLPEVVRRDIAIAVDGKPVRLSPTSFIAWLQCRQRWYYRNVERHPEPGNVFTVAGGAGHAAIAALHKSRLAGKPITVEEMVKRYQASFAQLRRIIPPHDDPDTEERDIFKRTQFALENYYHEVAPIIRVGAVETWLDMTLEIEDRRIEVVGKADLITADGCVIDHKIVSSPPQVLEEGDYLQLLWYALLIAERGQGRPAQCAFHYLIRGRDGADFRAFAFVPEDRMLERLRRMIEAMAVDIRDGRITPNPLHPYCSPDGCPHWDRCHDDW